MLLKGSCNCKAVTFEVKSATPYPFMRCYCSICRKTAGGGGYAINIMGEANTLQVKGRRYLQIYHATPCCQRHFCKKCGSCLWIYDPEWPDLVHPFASAIDTSLPKAPQEVYIMLDFAAPWCKIPQRKANKYYGKYPKESIESWHKQHGLYNRITT
jgi:hypothetical protein